MSTDLKALVTHPNWKWMPGVLDEYTGRRVDHICEETGRAVWMSLSERWHDSHSSSWHAGLTSKRAEPAVDDPATLGCMEALMAELWQEPGGPVRDVWLEPCPEGWQVCGLWAWYVQPPGPRSGERGPTKFDALAAAIMAAPVKGCAVQGQCRVMRR